MVIARLGSAWMGFGVACVALPTMAATDPVQSAEPVVIESNDGDSASRYSVGGLIAGAYQFEIGTGNENEAGALAIRPSIEFALTGADQFFLEFAVSQGNGVNGASPFSLANWGADLEDDLENINGSDVDALQNLWYRRTFSSDAANEIAVTVGFIDSTSFLDQNEFANDEYTQFINEVFVNAPVAFFQSYDLGAAVEWSSDAWSVNGTVMRVSENDDGNAFFFGGAQVLRDDDWALLAVYERPRDAIWPCASPGDARTYTY